MTDEKIIQATVTGISDYSPGPAVTNTELEDILQVSVSTLMKYFGIESRHFVVDPSSGRRREPNLGTSELAARAAESALTHAGLEPAQVDCLITASSTPDERLPPLTYKVQRRLRLGPVRTIDLRGGRTVAMQALITACALIESGRSQTILITAADCISPHYFTPLLQSKGHISSEALMNGLAFSDGAGAIVVQARPERTGMKVAYVDIASNFHDRDVGFTLNSNGEPIHNHRAIREYLPEVVNRAMEDLLLPLNGDAEKIDILIVPQVNRSMLNIAQMKSMNEKRFYIGGEIGNCPAPAIYRALARAIDQGRVVAGKSRVGVIGIETASWCYGVSLFN